MKLFVDTWGWLTLRDKRESQHEAVTSYYTNFQAQNGEIFTTNFVLDETYTLLFKRLPFSQAEASMLLLDKAILNGQIQLVWITPERFSQTQVLRLKLQDKPNISFTDLSTMIVMAELGIVDILTGDSLPDSFNIG
jgi:predicted nucleic acid-binding protein